MLIPLFIEEVLKQGKQKCQLKVKFVSSEQDAGLFLLKDVFTPNDSHSSIPSIDENLSEWIEFKVIDEDQGDIGILAQVLEYPSQILMSVISKDEKEILIPITENTFVEINEDKKEIHIRTPEGLIDLYIGEED